MLLCGEAASPIMSSCKQSLESGMKREFQVWILRLLASAIVVCAAVRIIVVKLTRPFPLELAVAQVTSSVRSCNT